METIKKNVINFIIIILLISLFSFKENNESDAIPIGTVIYSIMPPAFFEEQNPDWVLLKGQKFEGNPRLDKIKNYLDDFHKKQNFSNLPNALGMFIRSTNYNGKGIDTLNRDIGSYQTDATKRPNKIMTGIGIAKNDTLNKQQGDYLWIQKNNGRKLGNKYDGAVLKSHFSKQFSHPVMNHAIQSDKFIISNHIHNVDIIVDSGGDLETRPKNISLYTYIKIK